MGLTLAEFSLGGTRFPGRSFVRPITNFLVSYSDAGHSANTREACAALTLFNCEKRSKIVGSSGFLGFWDTWILGSRDSRMLGLRYCESEGELSNFASLNCRIVCWFEVDRVKTVWFIVYMIPEHALSAYTTTDRAVWRTKRIKINTGSHPSRVRDIIGQFAQVTNPGASVTPK